MGYFYDEPDGPRKLHDELCAAVQGMDVARIQALLSSGARPVAGMTRNPLALASSGLPSARVSPIRLQVVDLLLDALDPGLDHSLLEDAFREVFSVGDRPVLEKILPRLKQGIDTPVGGKRILMASLLDLDYLPAGYPGQMDGLKRFVWVMEKGPDLSPSPGMQFTQSLEFLPFALFRFSSPNPGGNDRTLYERAVDRLMDAKAPIWFEESPQSFRAGKDIVRSANPRWMAYLVENFPRKGLEQLLGQIKEPKGQALLLEQIMKVDLEGEPSPDASSSPRPGSRF